MRRLARLLAVFALWLATAAVAEVAVPSLSARVTDLTGTLTEGQRGALDSALQGLEAEDGAQAAILLLPSTQPEAIEQYSIRVVEAWKLGRKGKDNGLLILVAKNDRKVWIEVGYGLEGLIPDAIAKRVIDENIAPRFKQGDFAGGLTAGVERLTALIQERKAAEAAAPQPSPRPPPPPGMLAVPPLSWSVMDTTDSLADEQASAVARELDDFYQNGRTKPAFIVIVADTRPEGIEQYAARVLKTWGEYDNLDVYRSLVLVISTTEARAHLETGAEIAQRTTPEFRQQLVRDGVEPLLRKGELAGAVQGGVKAIETLVDTSIENRPFSEKLIDELSVAPIWLLIGLAVIGTVLRRILGPLFGGLVMGGAVAYGAWFVSGEVIEIAVAAGFLGFIFVLVGLANWIGMALSGVSGGGGGGGGFSGGGGDFGGGGASGSW